MSETRGATTRCVRLAIVGCGQIGRVHAQRLQDDPRAQIIALCDPQRDAAERLRDQLAPGAAVFDQLHRLLDASAPDAAIIATPTRLHYEQVRACRARGLHVLCEKPLADTRQRITQLIADAQQPGPVLTLSYQRRYDPNYRTLRREARSGRWGPVQSVTSHNAERWQQTIAGTWRDDPALNPGGFLGDAGSHKVDMLCFVTGLGVQTVCAYSDRRASQVEIVTTIAGLLSGGAALSMNFIGDAQHWREDFHIHLADADLMIRDGGLWIARQNRVEPLGDLEPGSNPDAAFLEMITAGAPNVCPADCALPVFDFTEAVLQSARTGQPVHLSSCTSPSRAPSEA